MNTILPNPRRGEVWEVDLIKKPMAQKFSKHNLKPNDFNDITAAIAAIIDFQ